MAKKNLRAYWKKNLQLLGVLLAIWFLVSYGFGIVFVDTLNQIRIGGYKLGFGLLNKEPFMCLLS